jgi:hypothetical protein
LSDSNITIFEYNITYANLTNTTATDWVGTCDVNNLNQTRNWTQYDANALGCYINETFIESNYSTANLTYTAWTDWTDISCSGQQMNQTRNRTQYDDNSLGCFANITTYEYQLIDDGSCDTIAPAWVSLNNKTCYVNESCSHLISASDYYGTINYFLNDTTNFRINITTGTIINNTLLSSITIHYLNASVNDSAGNLNSGIFFINVTARATTNVTGSALCRYRLFGYWNSKLSYYRESNCI